MNRTIKFRGKRIDNGEWVYGDLVINQRTQTYRIFTDFANVRHGSYTDSGLHECSGELYHINPTTIGQFTGLTDRNGKEIYEGDIINTLDPTGYNIGQSEIKFGEFEWKIGDDYDTDKCVGFYFHIGKKDPCPFSTGFNSVVYEVIGNIHDK